MAAAQALSGADTISVDVEANDDCVVLLLKAARIVTPCENACAFHARRGRNIMRTLAFYTPTSHRARLPAYGLSSLKRSPALNASAVLPPTVR